MNQDFNNPNNQSLSNNQNISNMYSQQSNMQVNNQYNNINSNTEFHQALNEINKSNMMQGNIYNKKIPKKGLIVLIILILVIILGVFLFFKLKKEDKIFSPNSSIEILILGERKILPFKANYLINKGFDFAYPTQKDKLFSEENLKDEIYFQKSGTSVTDKSTIFTYCNSGKAKSIDDVYVIQISVKDYSSQKEYLSVEGFSIGDSYLEFKNHMDKKYEKITEIAENNMNILSYNADDMSIRATDRDGDDIIDEFLLLLNNDLSSN